jgi:TolB protein
MGAGELLRAETVRAALARGGTILYERERGDGVTEIWSMDSFGGRQALFFSDAADVDVRHDLRGFAFDRTVGDDPPDIYVADIDGSSVRRLTQGPGRSIWPDWSPDGSSITFSSDRDGKPDVYVMDANGGNVVRLTDVPGHGAQGSQFSPDGRQILFVHGAGPAPQIAVMNAEGSDVRILTSGPDLEAAWSRNGQQIAFISVRDGVRELYIMDADGANQRRLTQDTNRDIGPPSFSPDGDEIAWMSRRGGNYDVWARSLRTGTERRLTTDPAVEGFPEWIGAVLS